MKCVLLNQLFPRHLGDIISPAGPGSVLKSLSTGMCLIELCRETSVGIPKVKCPDHLSWLLFIKMFVGQNVQNRWRFCSSTALQRCPLDQFSSSDLCSRVDSELGGRLRPPRSDELQAIRERCILTCLKNCTEMENTPEFCRNTVNTARLLNNIF